MVTQPPLTGVVLYLDTDGDGVRDATEPSRVTNTAGTFRFRNLFPSTYVVRQEVPNGFVQRTPGDVTGQTLTVLGGSTRRLNFGDTPAGAGGAAGARGGVARFGRADRARMLSLTALAIDELLDQMARSY
jgi:hypothetical protein